MEIRVFVIHRDQPASCAATVRSFLGQGDDIRVTIVDNGSRPEALQALRDELPDAAMLLLGRNCGFGPAANAGLLSWLKQETGEWAVIAPHDALPEAGSLQRLLAGAQARPRAGIACAGYGDRLRPGVDRYLGGILAPAEGNGEWIPTDHPHGTMLACRRPCLQDIGMFDERYFAYVEEADLGLRALAAGWEVGVVVSAVVRNPRTSVGAPVVEYLQLRNTLLLLREHFGLYPVFIRCCIALIGTVHQALRPSKRAVWFHAGARMRAVGDFLRGRFGPPPEAVLRLA